MKDVPGPMNYERTNQTTKTEESDGLLRSMGRDAMSLLHAYREGTQGFTLKEHYDTAKTVGTTLRDNIKERWGEVIDSAQRTLGKKTEEVRYDHSPEKLAYEDLLQRGRESDQPITIDKQYETYKDPELVGEVRALFELAKDKVVTLQIESLSEEKPFTGILKPPYYSREHDKLVYQVESVDRDNPYEMTAYDISGITDSLPGNRTEYNLHATIGPKEQADSPPQTPEA